jgi:hypothetical protein
VQFMMLSTCGLVLFGFKRGFWKNFVNVDMRVVEKK